MTLMMTRSLPADLRFASLDQAMDRYVNGDDRAFGEVFRRLYEPLRTFLRRLCGSEELARDLSQETFLRMHRARASFARGQRVLPWAYTIARNCFVSHTRSPRARLWRASAQLGELPASSGSDPETSYAARETVTLVARELSEMSALHREAFERVRLQGKSVAAAATELETSEGAVKLRAFRASQRLRAALAARGHDASHDEVHS